MRVVQWVVHTAVVFAPPYVSVPTVRWIVRQQCVLLNNKSEPIGHPYLRLVTRELGTERFMKIVRWRPEVLLGVQR